MRHHRAFCNTTTSAENDPTRETLGTFFESENVAIVRTVTAKGAGSCHLTAIHGLTDEGRLCEEGKCVAGNAFLSDRN